MTPQAPRTTATGPLSAILRALARIDGVLRLVGAAMMICMMLIVGADVFSRYVLNAPFSWSYDLISVYLMAGVFFFFLSDTFGHHGHVAVDIVQHRLPARARHASLAVAHAFAVLVFALIFRVSLGRAWDSYAAGEVLAGAIAWRSWIAAAFVPIGTGMLLARLVVATLGHALSAVAGRDLVDLPPLSGSEEAI